MKQNPASHSGARGDQEVEGATMGTHQEDERRGVETGGSRVRMVGAGLITIWITEVGMSL